MRGISSALSTWAYNYEALCGFRLFGAEVASVHPSVLHEAMAGRQDQAAAAGPTLRCTHRRPLHRCYSHGASGFRWQAD